MHAFFSKSSNYSQKYHFYLLCHSNQLTTRLHIDVIIYIVLLLLLLFYYFRFFFYKHYKVRI